MQRRAISDPHAIDETLCRLGAAILPLRFLDPVNGVEERERFLASKQGNPQFVYTPFAMEEYDRLAAALDELAPDESPRGVLFEHTRSYLRKRLELLRLLGQPEFWMPDLYGRPPEELITLSIRTLHAGRQPVEEKASYGPELVVAMMEQTLRQYGLHEWKVVARHGISATNVESANRMVNVRADLRYSMTSAKRLIVHEIETHVLRSANGYLQPLKILGAAVIPGYLATEEGLALVNEERAGYSDRTRNRIFAARALAAHLARIVSFREIYETLIDYGVSSEDAWTTVKRAKRGLSDTTLPGGYIKDHVYLWGKLKLEQYIVEGGDLPLLYLGKLGLDHLDLVRQIGLRPPQYLPPSYRV